MHFDDGYQPPPHTMPNPPRIAALRDQLQDFCHLLGIEPDMGNGFRFADPEAYLAILQQHVSEQMERAKLKWALRAGGAAFDVRYRMPATAVVTLALHAEVVEQADCAGEAESRGRDSADPIESDEPWTEAAVEAGAREC